MAPVYRFADPGWREKAETNLTTRSDGDAETPPPVVSLDDEVRYTLGQKLRAIVVLSFKLPAGSDGILRFRAASPQEFRPGDRVVLEAMTTLNGVRKRHAPVVSTVELHDGKAEIPFEVELPEEYVNQLIDVGVDGTLVPTHTDLYHRTAPVMIPARAYLDFAFGIEEPAWGQGPVEFSVRACVEQECETVFREAVDPAVPDEQVWQSRRVELGRLANRKVSFSFSSRLLSRKSGAFSLPAWANPTVYAPVAVPDTRPNIILISLDTLSADHLPTYGYHFSTAPFLDEVLAAEGVVFLWTVAAATTTPQAHMSMFTSVQPCRHGVITGMEQVRPELVSLAAVLRAGGYETGAVTEDGWLGYQHGFGHGFNSYAENKSANVMTPEGQFELTLKKARAWLRRNGDKRFFLFLHTFQVHEPYNPPEQYKKLFREREGMEVGEASPRRLRELVSYDQEIRYTDDQLRAFFEILRESRLLENTVLIVTSDHGEEFFEHGLQGHGRNLFNEVTRVPLIFWGPGRIPQGERRSDTVGHIDLMPTILSLASVTTPPQVAGRNLFEPASSRHSTPPPARFTESRVTVAVGKDYKLIPVTPPAFMVQQGSRKVARYHEIEGDRYEAYDLASDPEEKSNRLPSDAAAFAVMTRLLDEYESSCAAAVSSAGGNEQSRRIELDPEREEKLRALGYLE